MAMVTPMFKQDLNKDLFLRDGPPESIGVGNLIR